MVSISIVLYLHGLLSETEMSNVHPLLDFYPRSTKKQVQSLYMTGLG